MNNSPKQNSTKDFLEELVRFIDVPASVSFDEGERVVEARILASENQQMIIGKQGTTLEAIQHLANLFSRKHGDNRHYRLDVNEYQADKNKAFLKRVEDYVIDHTESTEILLWPMSSYERRLVHEYFLEKNSYITESEDFGSKRVVRLIKK